MNVKQHYSDKNIFSTYSRSIAFHQKITLILREKESKKSECIESEIIA